MKFALVENIRQEATKGTKGVCPHCSNPVIAKCGKIKIHHWAHKGGQKRDCKWEPETQWHRGWKNEFQHDWQEHSQRDENGELHIADVLTPHGLAIELQHSPIDWQEVKARTNFYGNICWIVDGTRLKTGWTKFLKAIWIGFKRDFDGVTVHKIFTYDSPLLRQWAGVNACLVFDFGVQGIWVIDHGNRLHAFAHQIRKDILLEYLKSGQRPPPCEAYDEKQQWQF